MLDILFYGIAFIMALAISYVFYRAGMLEMQRRIQAVTNTENPLHLLAGADPVIVISLERNYQYAIYEHRCKRNDQKRREGVV